MNRKKYSKEHEWALLDNEIATIGITDHAQASLGDIVFIELPIIGTLVNMGDQVGVVESVKAASDLFSPVGGEIVQVNNELINNPQIINNDPENNGWYMKIKINHVDEINELMNLDEYKKIVK